MQSKKLEELLHNQTLKGTASEPAWDKGWMSKGYTALLCWQVQSQGAPHALHSPQASDPSCVLKAKSQRGLICKFHLV